MKKISRLSSVKNFEKELDKTDNFIRALEAQVVSTRELLNFTKARQSPDWPKFKKHLDMDDKQLEQLWEMGFVILFANFECFTFNFTRDLCKKYPGTFQSEKMIKFEEIKDFTTATEIKNYFIDSLAIQKSYDLDTWLIFLNQVYRITIFKNKKDLERFKMLNYLRNIFLHSGGKTNSKFRNDMRNLLKTPIPLNKKVRLDRKKYYHVLNHILKQMVLELKEF